MTSFLTLLKRDLRLQVPMMVIYSAVLVLIAGGFTWAAIKYSSDGFYAGIPIFFVLQFVFLMFALPINAIWKEWRMKTVAHWLMLPASVHKKIWSKALSVVIWTLYIVLLVVILWAITGLIGQTAIHTSSFQVLKAFLTVDLFYTIPLSLMMMFFITFPIFLAVIMVKGEKGWKGRLFTTFLFVFFIILIPWFYAFDPLPILEIAFNLYRSRLFTR